MYYLLVLTYSPPVPLIKGFPLSLQSPEQRFGGLMACIEAMVLLIKIIEYTKVPPLRNFVRFLKQYALV